MPERLSSWPRAGRRGLQPSRDSPGTSAQLPTATIAAPVHEENNDDLRNARLSLRARPLLKRFETVTLKVWEKHGIKQARGARRERSGRPDRCQYRQPDPCADGILSSQVAVPSPERLGATLIFECQDRMGLIPPFGRYGRAEQEGCGPGSAPTSCGSPALVIYVECSRPKFRVTLG